LKILVTGTAGFIGYSLAKRLLKRGDEVIGIDNINDYYDPRVKYGRLKELGLEEREFKFNQKYVSKKYPFHSFYRVNLEDKKAIEEIFKKEKPQRVCHLAAQAGVRYSLTNPEAYIQSNIVGFLNILEASKKDVEHLVYASSSSVYGLNERMPFSVEDNVDHPVSLYAASKKSNELMAHTYSHLFNLPTTGLRFFTVYGPWGRPDMALFLFTKAILEDKPIDVFNYGDMQRDFTYIDDIVEGVVRVIDKPPKKDKCWSGRRPNPASSKAPYRVYNIGNGSPVKLLDFIEAIENALGKKAKKNFLPMQMGDVKATWADTFTLERDFNYKPSTPIQKGINNFISWYRKFYGV